MASSGSVNFSLTRDNIIQASLEDLLIMAAGDTTSSTSFTDHSTMMARKLNMLVKQWMGKADFAPGLKTWTNKRAYLFLQKGEGVYTLGPTATATGATNKWASSYWTTTIGTSGEASGQTVITLTDGSVVTTSDRIGIVLNTGYIQWTTVSGISSNDATIAVALSSAAAAGNRVYGYVPANQGRRPLHILHALRRDTDNIDTPIDSMQLEGYERVVKKTNEADPNYYYYEAQLTDGVIYFDSEISDCTDVIRIVYASPTEDFDAAADDADYPQEWLRPLALGLSVEACGNFQQEERAAYFKTLRDEALAIARHTTPENSDLYFMPGEAG
jgi:hypothetical protein